MRQRSPCFILLLSRAPRSSRRRDHQQIGSRFEIPADRRGACLARASRQRRWSTLPISADRSVPQAQKSIQGHQETLSVVSSYHPPMTSMSPNGVECRVDLAPASALRGADRQRRLHRAIATNKPSTSVAARRPLPAPQSAAQAAGAAHAGCGSISMLIALHGLRSGTASDAAEEPLSERGHG